MSFLFRSKTKPSDLVRQLHHAADGLGDQKDDKHSKKALEKVATTLAAIKEEFYSEEPRDELMEKLVEQIFERDTPRLLIDDLRLFDFESQKQVAAIFNYLLRRPSLECVDYFRRNSELLQTLTDNCWEQSLAINCGDILRDCLEHESLNDIMLNSPLLDSFFQLVQSDNFDVASDAFRTFKKMLRQHEALCSRFLHDNYASTLEKYNKLIECDNYVTKRQSLKLLAEILLERSNFGSTLLYINDPINLKIMMNLLRHPSKSIQFEAFHVFKIFVANPKKCQPVLEILTRNRDLLIDFLQRFRVHHSSHDDKQVDKQFDQEKEILLDTLQALPRR